MGFIDSCKGVFLYSFQICKLKKFNRNYRRYEILDIYRHLVDSIKWAMMNRDYVCLIPYKGNQWYITSSDKRIIVDPGFTGHEDTMKAAIRLFYIKQGKMFVPGSSKLPIFNIINVTYSNFKYV